MGRKGRKRKKYEKPQVSTKVLVPAGMVVEDARRWACECGLVPPLEVAEPKAEYFGYTVTVRESGGKRRSGMCRFDREGKRAMWEMSWR